MMSSGRITRAATGWAAAFVFIVAFAVQGAEDPSVTAERILEQAGVQGGLIVHLGCGDGRLTVALRAGDGFLVHGLDCDPEA